MQTYILLSNHDDEKELEESTKRVDEFGAGD